jgi:DNA-binding SARP family transcriptional activator/pimeloyl-ACP methyl ester carboxylesterase/class 3 adenylate cyclase/predicted ATPase
MRFQLLGPLEVQDGDRAVPLAAGKQCALLSHLLLNANRAVPLARLVDDLWGDRVPGTAVKALQVYVSKLRKALPADRLHTRGAGYLLEVREGELDLDVFTRLAGEGRRALQAGDAAQASELLGNALALWRGPALAELDEPFAQSESARLEELRQSCLEDRIDADLGIGRHRALVPELEALVSALPLRERLRSQLILALYRSGRQAEALDAYQAFRRKLDEELGIEPTPGLRELERRVLQQDPALDLPPASADEPHRSSPAVSPPRMRPLKPAPDRQRPVGREAELRTLERVLSEVMAGTRRVVFVTGEPGAGKTTLVESFLADAEIGEALLVGRGQCIDNRGLGEPYLPILEAIGRLGLGEHGALVVEQLRRFAPTWLVQLPALLAEDEREWVERRASGVTRERMLREMTDALDGVSAEVPLALVLEDLHWSDPSTLDLVETIARRPDPAPLLVIGTCRTGEAGGQVRGLERSLRLRNLCSEVAVGPLSSAAVAEYLSVRLPGNALPLDLAADVTRRTRGIPLFVEKLVDSWLEGGAVERDGDGWRLNVPVEQLRVDVPDTVRELIAEQFRAIGEETRELLEAASVVGAEFSAALAGAGISVAEERAETVLSALGSDGMMVEARREERWPDGTVTSRYAFTHDLFQEWLYDSLPAGRRARIHQRIGARLQEAHGARSTYIAPELAWHFSQAHDAERAVTYLLAAAEQAFRRSAAREALQHVESALQLVPEIADEQLRKRLEVSARFLHGPAEILVDGWASPAVESSLTRALALARERGEVEELGQALFKLAVLYEVRGHYQRSGALMAEALALPRDGLSRGLVVDSLELAACSLVHQGRHAQALEHADWAVELSGGDVFPEPVAVFGESPGVSGHVWGSLALWHLGRPDSALERAERGVAAAAIAPRAYARGMANVNAAIVSQCIRNPAAVRNWAEAGIEASGQAGYPYWKSVGFVLRGWARVMEGDTQGGLAELRDALEAARSTGARLDDPYFLALLADACLSAGEVQAGLDAVDEGIREMSAERSFFCEPELHRLRGDLLLARGDRAEADAALERAVAVARRQGARAYELRAMVSLARMRGDRSSAELVAALVSTMPEGRDTPDVLAAHALLDELGLRVPTVEEPTPAEGVSGPIRAPVRYASSGELSIAYQVTGEGPVDLLLVPGFVSHLEKDWEDPRHAHFLRRLGSFSRLIRFDKRGTGLSDRPSGLPDLETRMDDLRAVMDASGSERAFVFGYSEGGPLSILFAATYPERVRALILFGVYAKRSHPDDDYPWAPTPEARAARIEELQKAWAYEHDMRNMCPNADDAMARWWGERCRAAASPGAVRALSEMNSLIDVRHVLGAIHVPTLVVHRGTDFKIDVAEGRYIADRIPGAQFVELAGADHFVAIDPDQILDTVEPFVQSLTAEKATLSAAPFAFDRVLKTLMLTHIVDTASTASLAGNPARELVERHGPLVHEELRRYSGEEVEAARNGILAAFDGPARAIRCAQSIVTRLRGLGLDVRVGVHTGEVEQTNGGLHGMAVDLAGRIAAVARPGEVLVSATTRDLVAGSGLAFVDQGERVLEGVVEPRRVYAASA